MNKKRRLVKRYQNRKLYDTSTSRYVTLEDIAAMIREGEDVQIVDNRTKDDLTGVTLTQIIFEQEKKNKSLLPLQTLKKIVASGGEKVAGFVQSTIESGVHSITHARDEIEKILRKGEASIEESGSAIKGFIDDKLKGPLESVSLLPALQNEIRNLQKKIDLLENKLRKYEISE